MNILQHYASVLRFVMGFAAITASATAVAQELAPNTAQGSVTVSGKKTELRHAYSLSKSANGSVKAQRVLILTEKPVSMGELTERVDGSGVSGFDNVLIDVTYDDKQSVQDASFNLGSLSVSTSGGFKTVFDTFSDKTLKGRLTVERDGNLGKSAAFDIRFNAVTTAISAPDATGAKAWETAQGKALAAYVNALRSRNTAAIKRTVVPEFAAKVDGPKGKMLLEMIEGFNGRLDPKTADFVYLRITGEKAKASIAGRVKDFGEVSFEVRLRRVGDVWLVAPPEL